MIGKANGQVRQKTRKNCQNSLQTGLHDPKIKTNDNEALFS
jgi:hypothetical protein